MADYLSNEIVDMICILGKARSNYNAANAANSWLLECNCIESPHFHQTNRETTRHIKIDSKLYN